jgi:hypothetical protein
LPAASPTSFRRGGNAVFRWPTANFFTHVRVVRTAKPLEVERPLDGRNTDTIDAVRTKTLGITRVPAAHWLLARDLLFTSHRRRIRRLSTASEAAWFEASHNRLFTLEYDLPCASPGPWMGRGTPALHKESGGRRPREFATERNALPGRQGFH